MRTKQNVPFLERCGLTLEKLAEAVRAASPKDAGDPASFSIHMLNDVKLSDSRRPSVPTAKGCLELLRVKRQDDLLTVADVNGQCRERGGRMVESHGSRLYALKTATIPGASVFMFLSQPPAGVVDDKFLPADGTVILYDNACSGPRFLEACGIEQGNGQRFSWIFNAVEI